MKIQAIAVKEIGGPEVLRLEERELGDPGPGKVRIRVRAAGVNYIDVYFRTGLYPRPLPFGAGLEGAGEVEGGGVGDGHPAIQTIEQEGAAESPLVHPGRAGHRPGEGVARAVSGAASAALVERVRGDQAGHRRLGPR